MALLTSNKKFSQPVKIDKATAVTDIVLQNYRTADVFLKYDIEFCCGGKWPLEMVCASKNLDAQEILRELEDVSRVMEIAGSQRFRDWNTGFLISFIANVYHLYFRTTLPAAAGYTDRFLDGHLKKFPELKPLRDMLARLSQDVLRHLAGEEGSLFPYINQITNAYLRDEPYARLLVKTMKKPWEEELAASHLLVKKKLDQLRLLTNNYELQANACTTHRVSFLKLRELDRELTQYLQLEEQFLLPKVSALETALLGKPS